MRASRARARKRRRGAVFVVAATVWHGRRNDAATAIFVGAAVGRPCGEEELFSHGMETARGSRRRGFKGFRGIRKGFYRKSEVDFSKSAPSAPQRIVSRVTPGPVLALSERIYNLVTIFLPVPLDKTAPQRYIKGKD